MNAHHPAATAALLSLAASLGPACSSTSSSGRAGPLDLLYVAVQSTNVIAALSLDAKTGAPTPIAGSPFALGAGSSPTAIATNGRFVFTSNAASGNVSSFGVDSSNGALREIELSPFALDQQPFSELPMVVSPSGGSLYLSSFGGGGITVFDIGTDGALSPIVGSPFAADGTQVGGRPFDIAIDPSGAHLYALAQGVPPHVTGVLEYDIDPNTHALSKRRELPTGNLVSPRMAIEKTGKVLFFTDALGNQIGSILLDAAGGASIGATSGNDPGATGPLRLLSDPSGRFLFATNYQTDVVSAFTISDADGTLAPSVPGAPYATSSHPQSLAFHPGGAGFIYVADAGTGDLAAFAMDAATGGLTPLAGSPFAIGPGIGASILPMTALELE